MVHKHSVRHILPDESGLLSPTGLRVLPDESGQGGASPGHLEPVGQIWVAPQQVLFSSVAGGEERTSLIKLLPSVSRSISLLLMHGSLSEGVYHFSDMETKRESI